MTTETTLRETLEEEMKSAIDDAGEIKEETEEEAEDAETPDEDEQPQLEEASEESEETEEEPEESEEELELAAPDQWADDDKTMFDALDDAGKTFILNRHKSMEADYTKKTTELAEQRKATDPFSQFVEKWEPHTQNLGVPLVHGLERLLENDQALRNGTPEQKQAVALQLLQAYGINLSPVEATADDEYADPQVKALQGQLDTLTGKLDAREQRDQQATLDQENLAVTSAQSVVTAFKEEKDDKGNLKYEHYDTLEKDILTLVQSGQVGTGDIKSKLESAYEKALWMNTTTREQLLKVKQSSSKREEIKKQSKAAAQAKKSAKANKTGTQAKAEKPKQLPSLREDIAAQIKEARSA